MECDSMKVEVKRNKKKWYNYSLNKSFKTLYIFCSKKSLDKTTEL